MIGAALAVFFSSTISAQTPAVAARTVLARVEAIVSEQSANDSRQIAAGDRKALALVEELSPYGWRVTPFLAAATKDSRRPLKVRLLIISLLGKLGDPASFGPLEDILLDQTADASLRALAAHSLPDLGVSNAGLRRALCTAITQDSLPREALNDALLSLSHLGCQEPDALERISRAFGPNPKARDLATARMAMEALGSSRGSASGRTLLYLVSHFPPRTDARAAAISSLEKRAEELALWLKPELIPVLIEALRTESNRYDTMLPLVRAARTAGPETASSLARLLDHPDAEVLAEAAEALAALKHVEATRAIEGVAAGALSDPRFSPKEGRPDPAQLLARIEKSAETLRRSR